MSNSYQFQFQVCLEDDEAAKKLRRDLADFVNQQVIAWRTINQVYEDGKIYRGEEHLLYLVVVNRVEALNL